MRALSPLPGKRSSIIAVLSIIMLLSLIMGGTAIASGQQAVLRVNVAPMYIENTSISVQVEGLYAINNIPQSASLTYNLTITRNGTVVETGSIIEENGVIFEFYFNGIPKGLYDISVFFVTQGVTSSAEILSFLVSPPPVPYTAFFLGNGEFVFHSNEVNATGVANKSYPFQVTVSYQFAGGNAQIVGVYNTTNMTFKPTDERQTVVVNVIDKWGWLNSESANIQANVFTGPPLVYTFGAVPNPYGSVWYENIFVDVLIIGLLIGGLYIYIRRRSGGQIVEDSYE